MQTYIPIKEEAKQIDPDFFIAKSDEDANRLMADAAEEKAKKGYKVSTRRKIGRNEPCPCGSGKKFKKCCIHRARTL